MPDTSWSFRYWQPAPRWRLHRWLAKPDNPAMNPHALGKTSTRHTDKQWKVEKRPGEDGEKPLNASHKMLLFPPQATTPISKLHNLRHEVRRMRKYNKGNDNNRPFATIDHVSNFPIATSLWRASFLDCPCRQQEFT